MNALSLNFDRDHFSRLFPFYILIDSAFKIESIGKSLEKICSIQLGDFFEDHFYVKRPERDLNSFQDCKLLKDTMVVIQSKTSDKIILRGQFEFLQENKSCLFVGTPWFGSMDQVTEMSLTISDFALHDPMIDLLHVLKTQEISNNDLKQLLLTINQQKKELKKANEEIKNIALFPTQNPDPIIRYNFSGEILSMNPAAEKLKQFEYEEKTYQVQDLLKHLSQQIDSTQHRWSFEAKSNGNDYSFLCINIKDQGYINIYGRDVTQQKKDQKELERLSLIIHETVNAVIVTDALGRVEWVNNAFTKITGYTLTDMVGRTPGSKLQGPDTDVDTANFMRKQIREAKSFVCEIYNYKKSGEGYWLRINAQPIFDKNGKVKQYFAIEEDITKEKQVQEQLKAAANRMATLITNFNAGILLESEDRKIVLVNQQFCDFFKIKIAPEKLIGKKIIEAIPDINSLLNYSEKHLNHVNAIIKQRKLVANEELEIADGQYFERDFVPIWTDNDYNGHLWIFRDVTESKKNQLNIKLQEEKYRNILSNMNLGLLEVDLNDEIIFANNSFCKMSGYSNEELFGKKAAHLFSADLEQELILQKSNIRAKGISDVYSIRALTKSGEERWWVISGAPRYNDKGELVGSVGVHLDITEQRKMEEELKAAKIKAEESMLAKENFLATMSHEIRTPLNAIVGIANLMQINPNTRNQESIDILSFSSRNLLALITDILDLSKIDAGKVILAHTAFNIKTLLTGIHQTFKAACEEKGVELILYIDDSVPDVIMGDELRLSQILNNLVGNAVKFTKKGFVKIFVTATAIKSTKLNLNFQVIDSGIGIKKENQKTIFAAFEQADQSISQKYGGTGLGLSITKKLIQLFGGNIKVESKWQKGSTFSFTIEATKVHTKELKGTTFNKTFKVEPKDLRTKSILIVEDNLFNQKITQSYLNYWGIQSAIANNGAEAISMLKKKHYDIALIDLFMPILDGFDAINIIRNTDQIKQIPIIALTASAETNLMKRAIHVGANMCLTKPFDPQQLQDAITGLLQIDDKKSFDPSAKTIVKSDNVQFTHINLTTLKNASMGSDIFIAEMLNTLHAEIPNILDTAQKELSAKEFIPFTKTVHKLKNNLLLLGLNKLRTDFDDIEKYGEAGIKLDKITAAFNQIVSVWNEAQPEIIIAKTNYSVAKN